ncbi:DUF935 domain-containing protein [Variovorax sp. UMC13]|uniref:DUF935 domain-containing protein n=1 Tax=Variovorax sp. UMC13 TaxID=1862326 RepID=UPI0015FFF6E0|nr:DUF935 domain-containing protein [Variovorax sp. UMC13]MBB1601572.1 hypothetical protein [Variovorax sp. UMC13]
MATSRILGADGQPIQTGQLAEPQTSRLGHLQRELQSHPTRGLTPSRLAQILDAAENGDLTSQFELFEDMEEKDGHIASEMGKRRRALLLEWEIVPPVNADATEKKNAEKLGELMTDVPDFEDMLFDVTDAIGKGFSCLEIEWHRLEGYWLPKTITHRPQSWFQLHRGFRQELRLRTNSSIDGVPGEPLQPFGWITHVHKAKSGYLERAALFRQLVWTYLFKNYSVGDLAEFLEIYGIPLRLGKYPPSASEREKATLLRALVGIGHNAAGIVPEGMLLEFHDAATGDPDAFALMIDWCEKNQSKVILGGTLTSGADGKSSTNALGNVHNEVRKDLRDSDIRQVNSTASRDLVYAIAALNGLAPGGIRRAPQMRLNAQEAEDLTAYADALPKLVAIGVRPTVQWVHEKLGIPQAQAGEEVLGTAAAPGPLVVPVTPAANDPTGARAAAVARLLGVAVATSQPAASVSTPPMLMAGRLATDLAPAVANWVSLIRDLVERAASLGEIRDGLESLLPDMTLDQYADAMAEAMRAAELAGRHEVLREAGGARG